MRDRILEFLLKASCPQTSDQVLDAVLRIKSPGTAAADRVIRGIIGDDPRCCFENGAWRPQEAPVPVAEGYPHAIALFIQASEAGTGARCLRGGLFRKDTGESLAFEFPGPMKGPDVQALARWQAEACEQLLIAWSAGSLRLWAELLRTSRLEHCTGSVVCLQDLAARSIPGPAWKINSESLAANLGMPAPDLDRPIEVARFFRASLDSLLELVPPEHKFPAARLIRWTSWKEPPVDFSRFAFGREYVRGLPASPGVYIMRSLAGGIIYVGKADNLKRRVSSYFTSRGLKNPKTARIHEQLYSLETVGTPSELDALLLESQMIRDFRPPVNLQVEVHEQKAGYGKRRNLILIAAQSEEGTAQLYFLHDGVFEGQQSARLGRPATKRLCAAVKKTYFPEPGRRRGRREAWEMEIASRWLSRHRRKINSVDIDGAGNYESALRQLNCYLLDPDKLTKKVLYR